jgi:hypothetical protein
LLPRKLERDDGIEVDVMLLRPDKEQVLLHTERERVDK